MTTYDTASCPLGQVHAHWFGVRVTSRRTIFDTV
jgi:hypothetical protein